MKTRKTCRTIAILLLFALCLGITPAFAEDSFPLSSLREADIPAYTEGSDYYIEINGNVPDFEIWQYTTMPFVLFSDLDELGRTGPAYACLGPETLPTKSRGPIGDVKPSGWQSTKYEGLVDGGNLFNRSHLIGHLLILRLLLRRGRGKCLFTRLVGIASGHGHDAVAGEHGAVVEQVFSHVVALDVALARVHPVLRLLADVTVAAPEEILEAGGQVAGR